MASTAMVTLMIVPVAMMSLPWRLLKIVMDTMIIPALGLLKQCLVSYFTWHSLQVDNELSFAMRQEQVEA